MASGTSARCGDDVRCSARLCAAVAASGFGMKATYHASSFLRSSPPFRYFARCRPAWSMALARWTTRSFESCPPYSLSRYRSAIRFRPASSRRFQIGSRRLRASHRALPRHCDRLSSPPSSSLHGHSSPERTSRAMAHRYRSETQILQNTSAGCSSRPRSLHQGAAIRRTASLRKTTIK